MRPQLPRMIEARRRDQLAKRLNCLPVKIRHAHSFVPHDEGTLADRILRGYAGGAAPGMALLRLDASYGEHEAARGVAPISSQRHDPRHVEGRGDFARGAYLDLIA